MEDEYHVYLLLDPTIMSEDWRDRVFYVGKGKGSRALAHSIECGETAKLARIGHIRESCLEYEILYATWLTELARSPVALTEREAFLVEAALIEALRPRLTNIASGHHLTLQSAASLDALNKAKSVDIPENVNALIVSVVGLRGGTDPFGLFVAPDPDSAWENARKWWDFGKGTQSKLMDLLQRGEPVALISIASTRSQIPNIVTGVYQISCFSLDPDPRTKKPKVVFERAYTTSEHQQIRDLRSLLLGNTLAVQGRSMILRQRRMKVEDRERAGLSRFLKTTGPAFQSDSVGVSDRSVI